MGWRKRPEGGRFVNKLTYVAFPAVSIWVQFVSAESGANSVVGPLGRLHQQGVLYQSMVSYIKELRRLVVSDRNG